MHAKTVIDFWFSELEPSQWWKKDDWFDAMIKERFGDLHHAATQGELAAWRHESEGRLAEIIVLDQFSRNIYRDQAESFASDGQALVLAQEAISLRVMEDYNKSYNGFLLMPFMHSESRLVHELAEPLFEKYAEDNLDFEKKHKVIIDRFGRYPHRNAILNRISTQEEIDFLKEPGSAF